MEDKDTTDDSNEILLTFEIIGNEGGQNYQIQSQVLLNNIKSIANPDYETNHSYVVFNQ